MKIRLLTCAPAVVLALAAMGISPAALAQATSPPSQADQDHSAHHPPADAGDGAAEPQPGRATPGMMGQSGQGGMMGGQGGMMNGNMRQMMSMMHNMMMMMSAQSGMMTSNVEGRIAGLKTELKITDAQAAAWDHFAEALRGTAKSMNGMYQQMMQPGATATLPARLARQEAMLSAHLSSVKTLKEALEPVYASFSDEQKKIADQIMIGPMGMM